MTVMVNVITLRYTMGRPVDTIALFASIARHIPCTLVALAAGRPDADGIATVDLTVSPASGAADAGAVCARVMTGLMGVDGIGAVALTLCVREGA